MPEFLEASLRATGRKKGLSGSRLDAYVYGTMNKVGAMHGNKETGKGRKMTKEHAKGFGLN